MSSKHNQTHHNSQRYTMVCLCVAAIVLSIITGCQHKAQEVHFARFEHLLFTTPPAQLQSELLNHRAEYATPLLNVSPNDAHYMQWLVGFVSDPEIKYIYHISDSLYHDLSDIERQLGVALARASQLCPSIHYEHFYTLVTAAYHDYQNRVFCDKNSLCLSIDHYAIPYMNEYQNFGVPAYMQRLLNRQYIVADCMAAIAREHTELPEGELTLLDYAIAEGKTLFFLEHTLPSTPDTILLRYSKHQLQWMKDNTQNVWGWLIQNRTLFSTDLSTMRNLIDEAPKTNAFGEGSAPRTAAYIGLQIVRAYVQKSHCSFEELFQMTDSQRLLNESAWRP